MTIVWVLAFIVLLIAGVASAVALVGLLTQWPEGD